MTAQQVQVRRDVGRANQTPAVANGLDFDRLSANVRRQLRELRRLDNHHTFLALLADFLVIGASIYLCVGVSPWFYPLALVLIGSTQRSLANFMHESSHKTLARNPALNFMYGTVLSGYLVFHLYGPYRNSHIGFHHRYLGDPKLDPDYRFQVACGLYDPRLSNKMFFAKNIVMAMLGLRALEYLKYVARDRVFFKSKDVVVSTPISLTAERIVFSVQWGAIVAACAWFGVLQLLFLFWFVPLFTTYAAAGWLSEFVEHYPLPESENKSILLTRNRHGSWIERFLLGRRNDNFHLVHHLHMGIPFWNVKAAHRVLLEDEAYAAWDRLCGGVFTRGRGRPDAETVISYAEQYRAWRQRGGDPRTADRTFAEMLIVDRKV